jgi:hypothetical protein
MNNFNKIPDTVLENALIGTSDLFNRNIIEHVCFQQRMLRELESFVTLFFVNNIAKNEQKQKYFFVYTF